MRITRARLGFMHILLVHQELQCVLSVESIVLIIIACGLLWAASAVAVGCSDAEGTPDGPACRFKKMRICAYARLLMRYRGRPTPSARKETLESGKEKCETRGRASEAVRSQAEPGNEWEIYEMYVKTARNIESNKGAMHHTVPACRQPGQQVVGRAANGRQLVLESVLCCSAARICSGSKRSGKPHGWPGNPTDERPCFDNWQKRENVNVEKREHHRGDDGGSKARAH
jgi:hypothetical protein